jgi:PAS domain S-box-containing protein
VHANKIIALLDAEHAALCGVSTGTGLSAALENIARAAAAQFEETMHACILLLDDTDRFSSIVAPGLPQDYRASLLDSRTGPRTSPFGAAAFDGAPVFSSDIAQDPAWTDGRKPALLHGLRACWAAPMFSARGRILGVFGMLFHATRHPTQAETELLNVAARGAAHAVERYNCEKSISDSSDHFRHAIELNAQVLWTSAADGQLDYVAVRWHDWTGTSGLGGTWGEAVHPDDLGPSVEAWSRAFSSGEPYDIEHRIRKVDGKYRWMHSRAYARRDNDGKIVKWYGSTEDIHEHWVARSALQESEAEFRMLARAMPNQAWAARIDGSLYWFNERVHEYTGKGAPELAGQAWYAVIHPDDLPRSLAAWAGSLATGAAYECEMRIRRAADGVYRWFLSRALPVRDEQGTVVRWVGTNTDVQEQKNAADKLLQLNESLEMEVLSRTADRDRMWRLSTDLMLVAEMNSMIVAVNPAWASVLGRSEADALGQEFLRFVHPDDLQPTLQEIARLEAGLTTLRFENRYRHRDGSYRVVSWTAVPTDGLIHAIGRDISQEKAARDALLRSEQALLQSQKMESIGKLTGGVAHDFNNVLQIISGNLQLLQLAVGDNPQALRRLETSTAAVERGAKLSSQLLAFARRQPLKPLVTDLGRLLRSMDELLRRAIGETIDAEIVVGGGLWHTLIDPNQLENVLINIAINARDAMNGHGKLTIELSNAMLDDAYASQNLEVEPGQYVMLAISDTGHGMDAATAERIFEPFFTTKREGEGTGLGLSMAYGFVKQSGGHIKVYSEPGQGSTFKIYLPRSFESLADIPVTLTGAVLGGSETILVVEDDLQVQATVVDILRGLGYSVLKANDAQSALTVVKSGIPIDLLFTDVVMPGELRSPELARQARALLPELEVLFTSGYTQNAIVHGGRLDPGVELLSKPYRREDLARKIRHLLANRKHVTALNSYRTLASFSGHGAASLMPVAAGFAEPSIGLSAGCSGEAVYQANEVEQFEAGGGSEMGYVDSGRNILLVEDNADAREMTSELLAMLGHTVQAVGSAEEALGRLNTEGLQVVMTDITLPHMSGVELAARVRREHPHLAIIFSSGHDQRNTQVTDPEAVFLLKPFSIEQLQQALKAG